jgi:tRNA (adenine57-N1/adenine58-N1)-methyltransferase
MTIALCRAVGDTGRIVSYELREEHRDQAVQNLEGFFG